MIAGLFRFVLFVFLAYVVFLFVRIWLLAKRVRNHPRRERRTQGLMVKDEVCGTYVPKEDALHELRDGQELYFCSEACRRKFLEGRTRRG